jgi:uncharacterized membrane protein
MTELIGHFHPLIIHLPIGILVVALLLIWLSRREKYGGVRHAIPLLLLCGSAAAIVACITGYLLSLNDKYDRSLVNWHMWMAIGVVLVSLILYSKEVNHNVEVSRKLLSFSLLALIMATGHFGSSLTRGSDYLSKPFLRLFSSDTLTRDSVKPLRSQHGGKIKELLHLPTTTSGNEIMSLFTTGIISVKIAGIH